MMAGALLLLVSTTSFAQSPEEKAGARAAALEGSKAFDEGRWSEAVDLFTRAESLVHSAVHLLYLARAQAKLGKLVRAREHYIQLTGEQLPHNAPDVLKEAKQSGEQELAELEPRVPYVSVVVQGAGPKPVKVVMDGEAVPPALLGVPRPVDPGEHKFQAFADGMESSVTSMSITESRNETVVLTLVPVKGGARPSAPSASGSESGEPQGTPGDQPQAAGGPPKVLTWVAFGVGAVGIGVGTVFLLRAKSKIDEGNELCEGPQGGPNGECPAEVRELDDAARSSNTIGTIGFIAGGVGVAAGVTLLLMGGGGGEQTSAQASVTPQVGPGWAGVAGKF
jgi:hypothetical protein